MIVLAFVTLSWGTEMEGCVILFLLIVFKIHCFPLNRAYIIQSYMAEFQVQLISGAFEHSVSYVWEFYALENVVFNIAVYKPLYTTRNVQTQLKSTVHLNIPCCVYGNLWFVQPKDCNVKLHILQSINFPHMQHGMLEAAAINTWSQYE